MDKLKLHTPNLTDDNRAKIAALFPHCVLEGKIDFDLLKQELSSSMIEGTQERYQLGWVGKREALLNANAPIAKTLRPYREESVNFDTTENLYIEGDNLDALKLLQETYLNKVKMIYIDPPYNTGNDFIYEDDFAENTADYLQRSNQKDDAGNRLTTNSESNGRFHSDWLSMMYPRLKLARNLLRDDGVIFISIDDNEQANLKRLCDEVFGEENLLAIITVKVRYEGKTLVEDMNFQKLVESVLFYAKSKPLTRLKKPETEYDFGKFEWFVKEIAEPKIIELGGKKVEVFSDGSFEIAKGKPDIFGLKEIWATGSILDGNSSGRFFRDYLGERKDVDGLGTLYKVYGIGDDDLPYRYFTGAKKATATKGKYYQGIPKKLLENPSNTKKSEPIITFFDLAGNFGNCRHEGNVDFRSGKKPIELLRRLSGMIVSENNDIILDFFSGSATTAHAVMQLNAEDGGKRKFIMVQIPETCDEKSEAFKAGYKTIADIGKERIRRAGQKIKTDNALTAPDLDIGFRVLKIDSSNMNEVYYSPDALSKDDLHRFVDNIKPDRSDEDLLFQVLLDWGVDLSLPIECKTIADKPVFVVADDAIVACFDRNGGVTETFIKELAKIKPLRAVFCDAGFASDSVKINIEQIFKLLSPSTDIKTI